MWFDVQVFMWVSTFIGTKVAFLVIAFILWRDEYHYSTNTLKMIWSKCVALVSLRHEGELPPAVISAKRNRLHH